MSRSRPLHRFLLIAATLVTVAALAIWAARGAHPGWSRSRTPVKQTDPVTGIEFTTWDERWTPGLDFLAGAGGVAAILALTCLWRMRHS
ncbi:MAG: hypothetical protein D6781_13555 [Verrucomicrobia bacterium]|nr:MAG: hypothetical protein D6781_13555 [Verrucomicrobiota bacterium]